MITFPNRRNRGFQMVGVELSEHDALILIERLSTALQNKMYRGNTSFTFETIIDGSSKHQDVSIQTPGSIRFEIK